MTMVEVTGDDVAALAGIAVSSSGLDDIGDLKIANQRQTKYQSPCMLMVEIVYD